MDEEKISFSDDVKQAVDCMKKGGIILYPTDTVWGIGCDATNSDAVKKIFNLKKRDDGKSMLVLVGSEGELQKIVRDVPYVAWQLIDAAENPITIIYDNAHGVAPGILGENNSLGIRITKEKYSRELCHQLRKPIVSTSANISGTPSAIFYKDISEEIMSGVDYIATYRRDDIMPHTPSNIIKIGEGGLFKIIR